MRGTDLVSVRGAPTEIVFYGNRHAGLVSFLALWSAGCWIRGVVVDLDTVCDASSNLMADMAERHGVPVLRGTDPCPWLGDDPRWSGDLLICVHGRRILPARVLRRFPLGGVNLHPFGPRDRPGEGLPAAGFPGARPVARAIEAAGATIDKAGYMPIWVCAQRMVEKVDAGEVLVCREAKMPWKSKRLPSEEEVYNALYPLYVQIVLDVAAYAALQVEVEGVG